MILAVDPVTAARVGLFVVKNWKKILPAVLFLALIPILLNVMVLSSLFSWVGWKSDDPSKTQPYESYATQHHLSWQDLMAADLGLNRLNQSQLSVGNVEDAFVYQVWIPEQGHSSTDEKGESHYHVDVPAHWEERTRSFSEALDYLHLDTEQRQMAQESLALLMNQGGSSPYSGIVVVIVGAEGQSFDVAKVHDIMKQFLGMSYVWGGRSPSQGGFDCSGLLEYSFGQIGKNLSGNAETQFNNTIPVPEDQIKPGDLVFFSTYKAGPSHVGMYVGNGLFLNANDNGVEYSSVDRWKSLYPFLGFHRVR